MTPFDKRTIKLGSGILYLFLALITFLGFATNSYAQNTPQTINLQAVLVDDGGNVLYDRQEANIIFSIIDGAENVYYEELQNVPVANGAISVLVGNGVDPDDGSATGGIPFDVFEPNGDRLIRLQLQDQSIPQEDLQLVSVPYSYYAEYAMDLKNPIESSQILDGTIAQDDLSQALLDYIDNAINGVSQQDLIDHVNDTGAHAATKISVDNNFTYFAGNNLQSLLEGVDLYVGIQKEKIESLKEEITDLQNQITLIDQDITNLQNSDTDLQEQITTNKTNITNVGDRVTNIENGSLDSRYVNITGDIMTGDLTMNNANIEMGAGNTVDGVDISDLKNKITLTQNAPETPIPGTVYKNNTIFSWCVIDVNGNGGNSPTIAYGFNCGGVSLINFDGSGGNDSYQISFAASSSTSNYGVFGSVMDTNLNQPTMVKVLEKNSSLIRVQITSDSNNSFFDRDFMIMVVGAY